MLSPTGLLLSRMSLNNAGSVVRAPSVVSEDIKIVMLGDSNVGKTCMCARFIQGRFLPDTTMTIGATYSTKIIRVGGNGSVAGARRAKVQIWDTAGQERFRSMARLYFREAKIGVVCFDITDKDTLGAAEYWIDELRRNAHAGILIALAANKSDLAGEEAEGAGSSGGGGGGGGGGGVGGGGREVSEAEAAAMADRLGVRLFSTSAVTGEGIVGHGNMFESMVEMLLCGSGQEGSGGGGRGPGRARLHIPERPQFGPDPTEGRARRCC